MIEVEVHSIRVSLMNQQRVIFLKDLNEERYLPIWIGQFEAEAITIELRERRIIKRPLTHDLLKNVLETMGGKLLHIFVNDMRSDVYFARLVIEVEGGETREIDARPSDAIALAVRAKVPIFVAEAVLERHGIEPEDDIDLGEGADTDFGFEEEEYDGEYEETVDPNLDMIDESQFSAFADFVNSLDMEDLDDEEN